MDEQIQITEWAEERLRATAMVYPVSLDALRDAFREIRFQHALLTEDMVLGIIVEANEAAPKYGHSWLFMAKAWAMEMAASEFAKAASGKPE